MVKSHFLSWLTYQQVLNPKSKAQMSNQAQSSKSKELCNLFGYGI